MVPTAKSVVHVITCHVMSCLLGERDRFTRIETSRQRQIESSGCTRIGTSQCTRIGTSRCMRIRHGARAREIESGSKKGRAKGEDREKTRKLPSTTSLALYFFFLSFSLSFFYFSFSLSFSSLFFLFLSLI